MNTLPSLSFHLPDFLVWPRTRAGGIAASLGLLSAALLVLALSLAPAITVATTSDPSPATAPYELVLLADAETGSDDEATRINSSGTILGTACRSGFDCQPVVWTAPDMVVELATPPYRDTYAGSINDEGLIVGSIEVESDQFLAALWLDAGEYTTLRTPDGCSGIAWVINNRGQIAGTAMKPNGASRLVLWTDREPAYLDQSDTAPCAMLMDMNDGAVIVGFASEDCEIMRAATWDASGLTYLPTLDEDATPDPNDLMAWQSAAWAINASGTIAGFAMDANVQHAVIWEGRRISRLDPPPGSAGCAAFDLNDHGTVVGQCFARDTSSRPLAWIDGDAIELPGGEGVAYGINNDGTVVGHVRDRDGTRAAMWMQVSQEGEAASRQMVAVLDQSRGWLPGQLVDKRVG